MVREKHILSIQKDMNNIKCTFIKDSNIKRKLLTFFENITNRNNDHNKVFSVWMHL